MLKFGALVGSVFLFVKKEKIVQIGSLIPKLYKKSKKLLCVSKKSCTFAADLYGGNLMKAESHIIESPIQETSRFGGDQEYLTADELMRRLEPHIRSLFR